MKCQLFPSGYVADCLVFDSLFLYTVNPLLSPPGAYFFQALLRGGLIERGGLKEKGGLFNLAKRMTCSKNTMV